MDETYAIKIFGGGFLYSCRKGITALLLKEVADLANLCAP